MKLQTKFYLGIIIVFVLLAGLIAAVSLIYVNSNTIHQAEDRVNIYARAAWEIYNSTPAQIRSALDILAQDAAIHDLLLAPGDPDLAASLGTEMEAIRQLYKMDILNIVAPDGTVVLRTRFPYNSGDNLVGDPLVQHVIGTGRPIEGSAILELDRLDVEGQGLVERGLSTIGEPRGMMSAAAVPVLKDGQLIGIVQMGKLLNGSIEEVDRIRDAVFNNEYHEGKPVGTATIFMDDLRISTNVLDNQGRRALGTRVSREVADQVLENAESWTDRAFVVDTWYLSQYDPIVDPAGNIIGMLYVGELEQKYLDQGNQAMLLYLSVVLTGMLLAFFVVFFITRGVLRPVRHLSEATKRISGGDLAYRVQVKGKDEISELSASFNEMAEQLQSQRQKIDRNQRELQALNAQLQTTNANYMDMLGFVSHELKNPLASATLSLYTVKDGYLGQVTPAQEKSLDSVATSLDYFQTMIQNYLNLSRLEKGELRVRTSQFSLQTRVIQPVIDGLQRAIEEKAMVIDDRIPEELLLDADGDLLRIVYNNLLSNAIKYGRQGGTILLASRAQEDKWVLRVRNDSPGIPQEKMPVLFTKFGRLNSPEYAGQRGTGLGLYICKEIVEKHGGEIWADSQVGQWVEFSFTLPK